MSTWKSSVPAQASPVGSCTRKCGDCDEAVLRDLFGDGQGFVKGDGSSFDAIRKGWAFDQFENQGPDALGFL